jgi:hypothetical protein
MNAIDPNEPGYTIMGAGVGDIGGEHISLSRLELADTIVGSDMADLFAALRPPGSEDPYEQYHQGAQTLADIDLQDFNPQVLKDAGIKPYVEVEGDDEDVIPSSVERKSSIIPFVSKEEKDELTFMQDERRKFIGLSSERDYTKDISEIPYSILSQFFTNDGNLKDGVSLEFPDDQEFTITEEEFEECADDLEARIELIAEDIVSGRAHPAIVALVEKVEQAAPKSTPLKVVT